MPIKRSFIATTNSNKLSGRYSHLTDPPGIANMRKQNVTILRRSVLAPLIQPIKACLKRFVSASLYRTGLLWLLARWRLNGKAVVLMYHRVLTQEEARRSFSHPGIIVTPQSFARHLEILKRHFRPLSLSQFEHHLISGESFPFGSCLITFDDGWLDNHANALPLLEQRDIPAVVFTATDYIGSASAFWQERLGHLLYESSNRGIGDQVLKRHGIELGDRRDDRNLRAGIDRTIDHYRRRPYSEIHALIDDLEETLRNAGHAATIKPHDRFMNWNQVAALAGSGVAIGSHSCSHRILTRLDPQSLDSELETSRAVIADRLGSEVTALAYPNGNVDTAVLGRVQAHAYRLAFTTQEGFVGPDTDALLIPRINIHEAATCNTALFLCRILRVF